MQSVKLTEVRFYAELREERYRELREDVRCELDHLASRIHTSLPGSWEVHVALQRDVDEGWLSAGVHRIAVFSNDSDDRVKVASLQLSLQSLLPEFKSKVALTFAFARPGRLIIREKDAPKEMGVASPHEEKLQGEWVPEQPRYTKKQWIVSDRIMQCFDDAVSIIRHRSKIYREWGFEEVDPHPRATVCFYGPAGTGKTMAAHVLAAELGCKIICAKYSQIESKYVGDAPKNLRRVFDEAKTAGAVLFFDEADSFLGKRMENVSNGSEQAINSLRGEMLILLEEFEGVVVFATNLVTNIDRAFDSRIISKIEFELPNQEARKAMILSKIPLKAPLEQPLTEAQIDKLVQISAGFSGRLIRSAMLMSFVKAARHSEENGDEVIRFSDFEQAFSEQRETAKRLDEQYQKAGGSAAIPVSEEEQAPLLGLAEKALSRERADIPKQPRSGLHTEAQI